MDEYEYSYDRTLRLLKDFREPPLSLKLICFRNSFRYRIEIVEVLGIKF